MQRKILIDTNVYIDIFNNGWHRRLRNPLEYIVFLAYPVLHELWMGAKGKRESRHLTEFQAEFIKRKRLVIPTDATFLTIGRVCHQLRTSGRLDPVLPAHYMDISIAALARQTGATVITRNARDFATIQQVLDFDFESP